MGEQLEILTISLSFIAYRHNGPAEQSEACIDTYYIERSDNLHINRKDLKTGSSTGIFLCSFCETITKFIIHDEQSTTMT